MYELREHGLYITKHDSDPLYLCGRLQVLAITRNNKQKGSFGRLIEWTNIDGQKFQQVILMRQIINDGGRQLRELLVDSGLHVSSSRNTWDSIIGYITQSKTKERAICVENTGWLERSYVTPGWTAGLSKEEVVFSGNLNDEALEEKGSLNGWQKELAPLCQNNPLLTFSVCVAIAAPLVHWLGWDSCGFHLVGSSKSGKTTAMKLAASIFSDENYWVSWRSTTNGLEAISASRNDMLLCLDEFHQASPEEVDQSIYTLSNGVSKIRSNQDGSLASRKRWKLLFLSTGEIGLSEMLEKVQRSPKAGQSIRFLEIPVIGKYNAFDDIHGYASGKEFADAINEKIKNNHGSLIQPWVNHLSSIDDLPTYLINNIKELTSRWQFNSKGNQFGYALDRFALLAIAGEMATKIGLLPWDCGDSEKAIFNIIESWIAARGYESDSEDQFLLKQLPKALNKWRNKVIVPNQELKQDHSGYWRIEANEVVWYLARDSFKSGLEINHSTQVPGIAHLMDKKLWLQTNEPKRGTLKITLFDKSKRYFKVYPERISKDLSLNMNFTQFISHN